MRTAATHGQVHAWTEQNRRMIADVLAGFGRFLLVAVRYRGDTDATVDHLTGSGARARPAGAPRGDLAARHGRGLEGRVRSRGAGPMEALAMAVTGCRAALEDLS